MKNYLMGGSFALVVLLIASAIFSGLAPHLIEMPGFLRVEFSPRESEDFRPQIDPEPEPSPEQQSPKPLEAGIDNLPQSELDDLSEEDILQRQDELERRLEEFENQQNEVAPQGNFNQVTNISGTWSSTNQGVQYNITQMGNQVTIQEISPFYGITAVGQGTITNSNIELFYYTAFYGQGTGNLTISSDGSRIQGTLTDMQFGTSTPALWYRQN